MYNQDDISIIIQGSICNLTKKIIADWRKVAPKGEIILSTWCYEKSFHNIVDVLISNPDPGVFPIIKKDKIVKFENINRQIVSTRAGIEKASRKICIKWRSDFQFCPLKMDKFIKYSLEKLAKNYDALYVFSINTANPYYGIKVVGQISDWMYLAKKELLLKLITKKTVQVCRKNTEMQIKKSKIPFYPISKFSCEQWMTLAGLKKVYGVNLRRFNDTDATCDFLKLIGKSIFIINPQTVGLYTKKYNNLLYPKLTDIKPFIGFRLSTISNFDCFLLGHQLSNKAAICILKLKALLLNTFYILKNNNKFLCD